MTDGWKRVEPYHPIVSDPDTVGAAALDSLQLCIFGRPGRPGSVDPAWLTSDVIALAQRIKESGDFAAMLCLGDALQFAGCKEPEILSHCWHEGPHVPGCWVLELLQRKS